MLPNYITNCLHKIAVAEAMPQYQINLNVTSKIGENFLGIVNGVNLMTTNNAATAGRCKQLHLIYKIPPANRMRRKHFKSKLAFCREIDFYTKLLPAFVRFQTENGLDESSSFLSFPKLYGYERDIENDNYLLILDDLRAKNFELWPKGKVMPLNYMERILIELAKFHAISFAMQDQRPTEFEQFKRFDNVLVDFMVNGKAKIVMDKTLDRAIGVLKNPLHKEIMQRVRNNYEHRFNDILSGPCSKEYAVICHGDCWNNNVLVQSNATDVSVNVSFDGWFF